MDSRHGTRQSNPAIPTLAKEGSIATTRPTSQHPAYRGHSIDESWLDDAGYSPPYSPDSLHRQPLRMSIITGPKKTIRQVSWADSHELKEEQDVSEYVETILPVHLSSNHAFYTPSYTRSSVYEKDWPWTIHHQDCRIMTDINGPDASSNNHAHAELSLIQEIVFVGIVITSNLMSWAAIGQALPLSKILSSDLDEARPVWCTAAFCISFGTFILLSHRLGDMYGHKRVFVAGYLWLGLCSLLAAFAGLIHNEVYFVLCRALHGIGAGLLLPSSVALLYRVCPTDVRRSWIMALHTSMAPSGLALGMLYSALFAERAWWSWTFWSFGIVAWFLGAVSVLAIPKQSSEQTQSPLKMDWLGGLLSIAGMTSLTVAFGLVIGFGKTHWSFYIVLAAAGLLLAALTWSQCRAGCPLLPLRSMKATTLWPMLLGALSWSSFGIWVTYIWRLLIDVRHGTPLDASLQFLPLLVVGIASSTLLAMLLPRLSAHILLFAALVTFFGAELITYLMPDDHIYWEHMFPAMILMSFALVSSIQATSADTSANIAADHERLAVSVTYTVALCSFAVGVMIAEALEVTAFAGNGDANLVIRDALLISVGLSGSATAIGGIYSFCSCWKAGWKLEVTNDENLTSGTRHES